MEIEIGDVIQKYYKGLECKLKGNPTNEAEFNANLTIYKTNGVETPTWTKVQSYLTEMQTDYANTQYQRDRKVEYPTIEECVHAILDDEIDALQIKRQSVKQKYPKEAL